MKKIIETSVLASLLLVAIPVQANTSYVYVPVIEAVPVYQTMQVSSPRQECWNEQVTRRAHRGSDSFTPVLISTVIGGAIGNAVGNGRSNKRVGAVVGAMLGHSVGRDIVRHGAPAVTRVEHVRHCEVTDEYYEQERLVGYHVRYSYHGEEYTVRMDHDPGERIQVRVRVEPLR